MGLGVLDSEEQRNQHRCADLLARPGAPSRRLGDGAGRVRRSSGGEVDALDALLEHDLAVERPVDRALRRDHAQALDLLLGQILSAAA